MKLTIEIDCDKVENVDDTPEGGLGSEVADMLRGIANDVDMQPMIDVIDSTVIFDASGVDVGRVELKYA